MSNEEAHGGPGPPQAGRESRWRRKRPAPAAARPLIIFSMVTALVFTATLAVVFLPRIIEPRQDIPQFTLDVQASPGGATIRVAGATMPQPFSTYRFELLRNGSVVANVSLSIGNSAGGITFNDANGNGLLDKGDTIQVATQPGFTYLAFLYSVPLHQRVGRAGPWQS